MITNADITLYSLKDNKYTRREIKKVFWNEVKESNTIKSGMINTDSVKIFIPLLHTEDLEVTTGKDILVKGIIDTEIDNTSQQTISASLKSLKDTHNFVTVSSCDLKDFGSKRMQHYVISCK